MAERQLKKIQYDNKDIISEVAIRDGQGNIIANTYVDKTSNQVIDGQKDFDIAPRVKIDGEQPREGLPDIYTQLQYVESNGSQYIDTTYAINTATDTVEIIFECIGTTIYKWLFGEHDENARFGLGVGDGINRRNVAYGTTTYKVSDSLFYNSLHHFKADNNGVFIDDTKVANYSSFSSTSSLALFDLNNSGFGSGTAAKIQSYKHTRNNVALIDLIPVIRNSDDKAGFYDFVSESFIGSTNNIDLSPGPGLPGPHYESLLTDANFALVAFTGNYNDLDNTPTNLNQFTNGPGYITSAYHDNTKANQSSLNEVTAKIPSAASSSNQLADKDFVNSSIETATATFRGTFESLQELEATSGDLNDYAFYKHIDEAGNTVFDRYKYVNTTPHWVYEYTLNNSSFTAAQWAAINSGVAAGNWVDMSTAQTISGQKNFNTVPTVRVESHKGAHNLPDEYQELQYISSSVGSGVINTSLAVSTDTYYAVIRASLINFTGNYGTIMGNNSAPQMAFNRTQWYVGNTGGNGQATPPAFNGTIYTLKYSYNGLGDYYVDDNDTGLRRPGSLGLIFFSNSTTGAGDNAAANIYIAEIYRRSDDELIYQFIPARNNSSNQSGFYETVNNIFYSGVGISAGPEDQSGEIVIQYLPVLTGGNFASVALTGNYDDLINKPTIPTVNNGTLTIQNNGTTVTTFTANSGANRIANISVPTKTSDLINNNGFITSSDIPTIPTKTSDLTNDSGYVTDSYHDSTKEDVSNKVISISSSSTNTQYPSAKCVYDNIQNVREVAEGLKQTYVVSDIINPSFNSQDDDITILSFTDINGDTFDTTNTSIGDTIYVKKIDVPDRWISLKLANIIQRAENGNFADNTYWPFGSISNNILTWSPRFQYDANSYSKNVTFIQNHKYLIMITHKSTGGSDIRISISSATYGTFGTAVGCQSSDNWVTSYAIGTISTTKNETMQFMNLQYSEGYTIYFKNFMIVDLTEIFGDGNEPTTLEEFKTYYSNDYYSYNETQGTQSLILSKLETAKVPIESISVNGTNISPILSNVDITVPTKTSDLTNDNDFITINDVPKELYWCTYGTTTYAEISAALNSNKLPVVTYNNRTYCLSEMTSIDAIFTTTYVNNNYFIKARGSSWSATSTALQAISGRVTSISSSSTNNEYPSAKCVYDNIENVREVAEGKKQTYVIDFLHNPSFNSQQDKIEVSSITTIDSEVIPEEDLQIGDNIYVIELEVPDRWVCSKKTSSVIQLCNKTTPTGTNKWFSSTGASDGLWTRTVDSTNNLITFTKKTTTTSGNFQLGNFDVGVTTESTHIYLTRWYVENNLGTTGWLSGLSGSNSNSFENGYKGYAYLITTNETLSGGYFYFFCNNSEIVQDATIMVGKPQVFDLTAMYGPGSEPSTYDAFVVDYPNDFYPYNIDPGSEVAVLSILETVKPTINSVSVNGINIPPILENVNIDLTSYATKTELLEPQYNRGEIIAESNTTNLYVPAAGYTSFTQNLTGRVNISYDNLNAGEFSDDSTYSSNNPKYPPVGIERGAYWNSASGTPLNVYIKFATACKPHDLVLKTSSGYTISSCTLTLIQADGTEISQSLTVSAGSKQSFEINPDFIEVVGAKINFIPVTWIGLLLIEFSTTQNGFVWYTPETASFTEDLFNRNGSYVRGETNSMIVKSGSAAIDNPSYLLGFAGTNRGNIMLVNPQTFINNILQNITGYDATKTQTLKNINGTFTWIDD